jgi:probable F420-dependent oxidoreductase
MKDRSLGVWYVTNGVDRGALVELAQRVEAAGYSTLWYPESVGWEAFALGGFLLGQTTTLRLGSGIANIYARDPLAARQAHDTLNALYGGRFWMGLGVSHVPNVEGSRGHVYGKPVATMRAYLERINGAQVMTPAVPSQVVIAALGPRMLALAAELCQGVLPYSVTPEHTARAREILGPVARLCVQQKVCLERDPDTARAAGSKALGNHLQLTNYRNNWMRLGFTEDDFAGAGSTRFLDAIIAWGDVDRIRERIDAHFAAGADHVCIQPVNPRGTGPDWTVIDALAPGA